MHILRSWHHNNATNVNFTFTWAQMWNNCIFLFNRLTFNSSLYSSWWQKSWCSYFRLILGLFWVSQIDFSFFLSRLASNLPWPSKLSRHWWGWVNVSMISLENQEDKTHLISGLVSPEERDSFKFPISQNHIYSIWNQMGKTIHGFSLPVWWLQIDTKWYYSSNPCLLNSVI